MTASGAGAMRRRALSAAIAAMLLVGCGKNGGSSSTTADADADAAVAAQDKEAEDLVKEPKSAEARQWLAPSEAKHVGFKLPKAAMLDWTNKFYAAGAKKVWVAGVETMGQADICALLVVEMPDDASARKAILKLDDQLEGEETPSPDKGNKFLKVVLD